jgi:hypothetical protein
MPNPTSGAISVSNINDSGTSQANMGSLVSEVIGGNSQAGQQISMSQYYFTFTNTLQGNFQQNLGYSGLSGEGQGYSVAISSNGSTAAVTYGAQPNPGTDVKTMVYTRSGSTWSLQQILSTPYTGSASDFYYGGIALSADGNTLAFGSVGDNNKIGAVWVYTRSGSTWTLQQKIVGTPNSAFESMGGYVALSASGNTLAFGKESIFGASTAGVWIWTRSGSTWTQQAALTGFDRDTPVALSADGLTLAVGDTFVNSQIGRAFIYVFSGGSWNLQTTFTPSTSFGGEFFGKSISLSADGNTCAVGAPGTTVFYSPYGYNIYGAGSVYVYKRTGASWSAQLSNFTPSDWLPYFTKYGDIGPAFGTAVSLSGDGSYLVVGGPFQPLVASSINTYGAYWILTRSGSTWSQSGSRRMAPTTYGALEFGASLAISSNNNYLVVGEPNNAINFGPNLGWVYMYG